ncbi:MAG: hypothetical protein WDN28_14495 [Chthoniobacter sp.]
MSLHGASEEERAALVPASKRWSLAEVIEACRVFGTATGRKIFFGWTLIDGVNDSPATAERLGRLLQGIDAHVNLIPLNPTNGFAGTTSADTAATEFQRVLRAANIPSTVRPAAGDRRGCRLRHVAGGKKRGGADRARRAGDSGLSSEALFFMLTIRDLKMSAGGRTLFENAAMQINYSERVALVGPNGAGNPRFFRSSCAPTRPMRAPSSATNGRRSAICRRSGGGGR